MLVPSPISITTPSENPSRTWIQEPEPMKTSSPTATRCSPSRRNGGFSTLRVPNSAKAPAEATDSPLANARPPPRYSARKTRPRMRRTIEWWSEDGALQAPSPTLSFPSRRTTSTSERSALANAGASEPAPLPGRAHVEPRTADWMGKIAGLPRTGDSQPLHEGGEQPTPSRQHDGQRCREDTGAGSETDAEKARRRARRRARARPGTLDQVDIGTRIVTGTSWKLVSQVVGMVTRAAVTIVLAHLLTPFEFGIVGLALVFAALFMVFGDVGLGPALVQRRTLTEEDRSTVFWTSLGVGALLALAGVAASPLVADFFDEPDVPADLRRLLRLLPDHGGHVDPERAHGPRDELPRPRARPDGGHRRRRGHGRRGGGDGRRRLGDRQPDGRGRRGVLGAALDREPVAPASRLLAQHLRDLFGFSAGTLGASFLKYLERNVDNLLIGRFLGPTALGIYSLSYNLMLYPLTRVADPIRQVMFPAFSRMQAEPERIFSLWLRGTRLLAALIAPAMIGLIVVAPDFVPVVLGQQWTEAVPVIRVLAWVGLILVLESLNASILLARGRSGLFFAWTLVSLAGALTAFLIGLPWELVGVALAFAVSTTVLFPIYVAITARVLAVSAWGYFRNLTGVATATTVMLATTLAVQWALSTAELGDALQLCLVVLVGAATYVPLCLWRVPGVRVDVGRVAAVFTRKLSGRRDGRRPRLAGDSTVDP